MAKLKQMILMRKDLNMRKGKMITQGAHASVAATIENLTDPYVKQWLSGVFTKIALQVSSEEELQELVKKADEAGFITKVITDAGLTEFHGVPTVTCAVIGPAPDDELFPITGHLKPI